MKLKIDHSIRIQKPIHDVYEAIVNPKHMNRYFTNKAQDRLEAENTVIWEWTDGGIEKDMVVTESLPPKRVVFSWPTQDKLYTTTVQFDLEDKSEKGTIVRVRDGEWKLDEAGLKDAFDKSEGWMHMLCCLKAYLDFNIDLRSTPVPEAWIE